MEIVTSNYRHPEQKTGQHTNGPANIFVREDDACPWYFVEGVSSVHKVRKLVAEIGLLDFQRRYCSKVES